MMGNLESRLKRLEYISGDLHQVSLLIADPETDAWATTDDGIEAEIKRWRAAGLLPGHVIVLRLSNNRAVSARRSRCGLHT